MDFLSKWFEGFSEGLDNLTDEERGRLFRPCASACGRDALKYLYQDLFIECKRDLDLFFERLNEIEGVDGKVIKSGSVYEILFLNCNCELHTQVHVNTPKLCECSRQSIIFELRELLPEEEFKVEEKSTILNGNSFCCFRITKKDKK